MLLFGELRGLQNSLTIKYFQFDGNPKFLFVGRVSDINDKIVNNPWLNEVKDSDRTPYVDIFNQVRAYFEQEFAESCVGHFILMDLKAIQQFHWHFTLKVFGEIWE